MWPLVAYRDIELDKAPYEIQASSGLKEGPRTLVKAPEFVIFEALTANSLSTSPAYVRKSLSRIGNGMAEVVGSSEEVFENVASPPG